jgi:type I restriction enzyme S subunit
MAGEWRERTLGDLTENFDGIRVPVKEADRRSGPYPYFGASGIVDYVDEYLLNGEYLLIAEDGENLRTRTTPIAFLARGKFWVNNHAHIVRGNSEADTRFLMYSLAGTDIGGYLTGSTMPKLTQGNMNRIPVLTPPLPEQHAIAHILGTLDDKIELNRRIGETLEAMARALFKSWFMDFEPVRAKAEGRDPGLPTPLADLFPARLVDSELGEIPEGWDVGSVYEIADVIYGAPFSSTCFNSDKVGEPLIRIRDLPGEAPGVWTPEVHPKGYKVHPGDIVVGMDGEFRAYLWGGAEGWLNQRVCVFKPKSRLSAALVRNAIIQPLADVEATETATTVIHLGKADIDRFRIVLANPSVAGAFNSVCQPWYDRIVAAKQETRTLAALRGALLPKLISGELRTTNAERIVEKVREHTHERP